MKNEGTLGIALLLASCLVPGVVSAATNVQCVQSVNLGGTSSGFSQTHTLINNSGETWVAMRWCLGVSCPSPNCNNVFIGYSGPGTTATINGLGNEIFVTGLNIPHGSSYTGTIRHGGSFVSCFVFVDPVCASEAPSTVGEASEQSEAPEQMLASWDPVAGMIDVTYMPACGAVDHNIYFGSLSAVGTYDWLGVECSVGISGTTSFDPLLDNAFFLIVGEDGTSEGSYGRASSGVERPEDIGVAVCERPQDLFNSCSN